MHQDHGAVWGSRRSSHWFQQPWESQEALTNQCIATKEMLPILVARGALPGPLFQLQDRTPLTKDYFIQKFRAALTNIGLEASQYAGHSFRFGAATTAAEKDIEDSLIKAMGRWKSQAYLTYIKTAQDTLAKVSSSLSHNT